MSAPVVSENLRSLKNSCVRTVLASPTTAAQVVTNAPPEIRVDLLEQAIENGSNEWVETFFKCHPGGSLVLNLDRRVYFGCKDSENFKHIDKYWIISVSREKNSFYTGYEEFLGSRCLTTEIAASICEGLRKRPPHLLGEVTDKLNLDLSSVDHLLLACEPNLIAGPWMDFIGRIRQTVEVGQIAPFDICLPLVCLGENLDTVRAVRSSLCMQTKKSSHHVTIPHVTLNSCTLVTAESVLQAVDRDKLVSLSIKNTNFVMICSILERYAQSCGNLREISVDINHTTEDSSSPVEDTSTSYKQLNHTLSLFSSLKSLSIHFANLSSTQQEISVFLHSLHFPLSSVGFSRFPLFAVFSAFCQVLSKQQSSLQQLFLRGKSEVVTSSFNISTSYQLLEENLSLCRMLTVLSLEDILKEKLHLHFPFMIEAISCIPSLEAFRWREREGGNLFTNSLVSIRRSMKQGFRELESCWIVLCSSNVLIDMTKTKSPEFKGLHCLLDNIIGDHQSDDSVQTFRIPFRCEAIAKWMQSLRPSVNCSTVVP